MTPDLRFELTSTATAGERPADDADWLPALVPGGVHESLVAAGRIGHPYRDANELTAAWVEGRTWWFRAVIHGGSPLGPSERHVLRFAGLDGVATVWLDEVLLGTHANQHRPASFDVTALLTSPRHILLLRFTPPLQDVLQPGELEECLRGVKRLLSRVRPLAPLPDRDRLALRVGRTRRRKAACSWGWDLGPRVPSIGLHGPVTIERQRAGRVTGVHARTTHLSEDGSSATVVIDTEVDVWAATPCQVRVVLTDPAGVVLHDTTVSPSSPSARVIKLANPQLWWTHDLGEQPLYLVTVQLLADNEVVDAWCQRIGVRTVHLDRPADALEPGRLFRFVLNGVPTFSRGANWVPASLLVGSVPAQRVRALVDAARHAEMTMLRVWGGGVYEQSAFYDACDEAGLLVWQDFMFACDDYPSADVELTAEVAEEAIHQVRRLRNHACLALWSGNNEVQGIHELTHGDLVPGDWGWAWFHELLPAVVAEHSPGTAYWPGSPWGEDETEIVNGVRDGDRHAWEVWHGIDVGAGDTSTYASHGDAVHFRRYLHDRGRFISEFGIHAMPELDTLRRWTQPGSLSLGSAALEHRNKDTPKDKGWAMMEVETGLPSTLEQYVDFSMACQAEGLKLGVEHYRRRQPQCSGTLVWQFNDVWPGLSWSVLDYDRFPKAGYWFLQRAYRPVLASFLVHDQELELWVTNSGQHGAALDLEITIGALAGADPTTARVQHFAGPYTSSAVWRSHLPPADHVAHVLDHSGSAPENRQFFAPLKQLPLTGSVTGRFRRIGASSAELVISSTGYSYLARVHTDNPDLRFSTNYVDLPNGASRTVKIQKLPQGFDPATLTVASYGRPAVPVEVE